MLLLHSAVGVFLVCLCINTIGSVRVGQCPEVKSPSDGSKPACFTQCSNDEVCPWDQKCCKTVCGQTCQDPILNSTDKKVEDKHDWDNTPINDFVQRNTTTDNNIPSTTQQVQSTSTDNFGQKQKIPDRSKTDEPFKTVPSTTQSIWDLIGRRSTDQPNVFTTSTQGFQPANIVPTTTRSNFDFYRTSTDNSRFGELSNTRDPHSNFPETDKRPNIGETDRHSNFGETDGPKQTETTKPFSNSRDNRFDNFGQQTNNQFFQTTTETNSFGNTHAQFNFHTENSFATVTPSADRFGSFADSQFRGQNAFGNTDNGRSDSRFEANGNNRRTDNFGLNTNANSRPQTTDNSGPNRFANNNNNFGPDNSGFRNEFGSQQNGFNRGINTNTPTPTNNFHFGGSDNFPNFPNNNNNNNQFAGTNIGSNSNVNKPNPSDSNAFGNRNPPDSHLGAPGFQPGNSGSDSVQPGAKSFSPFCAQSPQAGPCRAAFRRFYFESSTGDCKEFMYGGCEGNENNFRTIEECQKICQQVVSSPQQNGNANIPLFPIQPQSCNDPFEEWNSCGSVCEPACNYKPTVCTLQCVAKCFCKIGFVRNTAGGKCIPESQCPPNANPSTSTDKPTFPFQQNVAKTCEGPSACPSCFKCELNAAGEAKCLPDSSKCCPDGSKPANCFVSPCTSQKCTAYPTARCVEDYCGGCTAHFFDELLNEISKNRCLDTSINPGGIPTGLIAVPPPFNVASRQANCPKSLKFTGSPPCQRPCQSDTECLSTAKCCETTCGRSCVEPELNNDNSNVSPWITIGSPSQSSSLLPLVNKTFNDGDNPCKSSPCGYCQLCIQEAKQCVTTPCQQYRCEDISNCKTTSQTQPTWIDAERVGKCPKPKFAADQCAQHTSDCTTDSFCPGKQKCCSNGCWRSCVDSIENERPVEVVNSTATSFQPRLNSVCEGIKCQSGFACRDKGNGFGQCVTADNNPISNNDTIGCTNTTCGECEDCAISDGVSSCISKKKSCSLPKSLVCEGNCRKHPDAKCEVDKCDPCRQVWIETNGKRYTQAECNS